MIPSIQNIPDKKLIGMHVRMSMLDNKTFELWKGFIPRRKEITNNFSADLISMQVYDPSFEMKNFTMHTLFEKWAAVEVSDFTVIPEGMESFTLAGGLYAVFPYKGKASAAAPFYQYIFMNWLPDSEYILDKRPHFEILGEKYKNEDPESEEEVWIPIRHK